jgi:hypothetical protein
VNFFFVAGRARPPALDVTGQWRETCGLDHSRQIHGSMHATDRHTDRQADIHTYIRACGLDHSCQLQGITYVLSKVVESQ